MDSLLLALRVIVALGVVIAAVWFLRRRNSAAGKDRRTRKPILLVARQNLGPKVSVAVVDFGGRRFLLGVSEHGVTVLHNEVELVQENAAEAVADRSYQFAKKLTVAEGATAGGAPTPVRLARNPAIDAAFADSSSRLAGSVFSAATWKQAWVAIRAGR